MALRHRRGVYSDFDPSKMVAGEVAVIQSGDTNTTSGKSMYVAPTAGAVKRIAFVEDVNEIIYNLFDNVVEELIERVEELDKLFSFTVNSEGHLIETVNRYTEISFELIDGRLIVTHG